MHWWPSSVCLSVCLSIYLSVPCLTLSRDWKGLASWKLSGRKRMTRDPILRSKVKVTRPLTAVDFGHSTKWPGDHLMLLWPKLSHICSECEGLRTSNLNEVRWSAWPTFAVTRWRQRSKVSVRTSRGQFDPCLTHNSTKKSRRTPKLAWRLSVPVPLPWSKVKVTA